MAPFKPRWASLVTSLTPHSPRATKERKKALQKAPSSLGPTSKPKTSRSPLCAVHPDGDDHRHGDHPAVLADLDVGGVEPDVGVGAFQRLGCGSARPPRRAPRTARETWLLEMPAIPSAFTSSSTLRVETPWT